MPTWVHATLHNYVCARHTWERCSDVSCTPVSHRLVPSPSRSDPLHQGHQSERGVDIGRIHGHHHRGQLLRRPPSCVRHDVSLEWGNYALNTVPSSNCLQSLNVYTNEIRVTQTTRWPRTEFTENCLHTCLLSGFGATSCMPCVGNDWSLACKPGVICCRTEHLRLQVTKRTSPHTHARTVSAVFCDATNWRIDYRTEVLFVCV